MIILDRWGNQLFKLRTRLMLGWQTGRSGYANGYLCLLRQGKNDLRACAKGNGLITEVKLPLRFASHTPLTLSSFHFNKSIKTLTASRQGPSQ